MEFPADRKYTKDHEWVKVEGDVVVVGITDFAQDQLGDVVFIELPRVGKTVKVHDQLCVVESTKAASDVYAPLGGTIKEANATLKDKPEFLNKSPHNEGWIAKLENFNAAELSTLMDAEAYKKLVGVA